MVPHTEVITRQQLEQRPEYIFVSSLLICLLQSNAMDRLKGTPYYRADVKRASFDMVNVMNRAISRDMPLMRGPDVEADVKFRLQYYINDLLMELITLSTEHYAIVMEMIRKFKQSPNEVIQMFGIQLVEIMPVE